jgi:Fe-S-cluster containining protein
VYPSAVPPPASRTIATLNLYQDYRCRHSGVCCSAGWDIPIDRERKARVAAALDAGSIRLSAPATPDAGPFLDAGLLPGAAAVLARTAAGDCVFFDRPSGRLCAIQRALGHAALPAACRHFPRVILVEEALVRVSFSHVCPTAADLLFREDIERIEPVSAAGIMADPDDLEGFDAATTIPPFVRPQVVGDADSFAAWDAFVLAACDRPRESPPQVLARLARGAERLRAWSPAHGAMGAYARETLEAVLAEDPVDAETEPTGVEALYAAVRGSIPAGLPRPAEAGRHDDAGRHDAHASNVFVGAGFSQPRAEVEFRRAGGWRARPGTWRVVNRYMAARAWGAWSAYLGWGVRTQVAWVAAALAVLTVTLATSPSSDDAVDSVGLRAALGDADMLVVHQSDARIVCDRLAHVETLPFARFVSALGVTIR